MKKMTRSESGKLGAVKSAERARAEKQKRVDEYNSNPKLCRECSTPLSYEASKNHRVYCNSSCAASYNNKRRAKTLEEKLAKDCVNPECNEKILARRTYCSSPCMGRHRRRQAIEAAASQGVGTAPTFKRLLLETHGEKCWECGESEWLGHPIPLELEHVDGNSENNSLDNLKILCCNCHALTPTYKAKNVGNGRHYRRQRYKQGKSF
jgi:hypothetical protein